MTIKAFAFEVQSSLSKASGITIKRSHVHEVLAALLGYASYAALTTHRLLAQHEGSMPTVRLNLSRGASRAMELGHAHPEPALIAAVTAAAAEAARLYAVPLTAALYDLGVVDDDDDNLPAGAVNCSDVGRPDVSAIQGEDDEGLLFALDLRSAVLHESLARMAKAGSASAHIALVRLADEVLTDIGEDGRDGAYWFQQQQSGRLLTGIELEWSAQYRRKQEALLSRQYHLRGAVALGNAEAALRQVEIDPSDANFEQAARLAGAPQAARLGSIALFLGRDDDARKWLRAAARQGDTDAMKELAGGLEPGLEECWTWVHLARMLGVDVMSYHAVGDDGFPADADEAGPIYAAGGFDLEKLPEKKNAAALEAARQMFATLMAGR